jgi:arylsulfatase A-like enzyme
VRNGIFTAMPYPVDRAFRVFLPNSKGGLPASEVTIPQMLKGAGYRSSLIGKWHLGHVSCLPTQRGFDEFYGLPYPQDEGCASYSCTDKSWPGVPLYNGTKIIQQPVDLNTLTPKYNVSLV